MAKKEKANLNKVIVESLTTVVKAAKISTTKITPADLETLGIIDTTGAVRYDERELRMLAEATQNLFKTKNPGPLFDLLRIKNPEYSEEVIGNDFFQEKYREITGQNKTLLGYDHRIKALEQRFKPHVTTGKLRVMLDDQEVAPLAYMQILASAARTEKMYTGTAQLREIFKSTQDELITGLFREPDKSKEIKFDEDRQEFLEGLGVDVERLRTTINGGLTEQQLPDAEFRPKYNMRYFDESLTDEGIERIAHAAKATYTTIATPFFESAMGIRRLDPTSEISTPVDMRTVSAQNREMLASFLALKPDDRFIDSKARIDSYAEVVSAAVDNAVAVIKAPENEQSVASGRVHIGHELAYRSAAAAMGAEFADMNYVLRRDLTDRLIESSAIATASRAEFLRNALSESMNPDFIREHFGDYYFGETTHYRPVVDQEGNPAVDEKTGERVPPKIERTGTYPAFVFVDNNVYPVAIQREAGTELGEITDADIETVTHFIHDNIDTRANLRSLSADNIKFGVNPMSQMLYTAYEQANAAEMEGREIKNKPSFVSEKPTKPVLYRDLPLYKQYVAEARQRLDKYVIAQGGPVIEGEPYIQERVITDPVPPPVPPKDEEETDTRTDYENWKIIETTRKNYSGSLKRLTNARSEISAEIPEGMDEEAFKQSEEYRQAILSSKAYRQADQNWVSFNENLSVVATGYLVKIFKNRDAELQPEEGEPIQTEYGIMANMFESVLKTRRLNEIQKGLKDGSYEPQEGEDVYTSVEEVTAAKESEILARYNLNTRLLELGKVDEMSSVLLGDKQPTAPDPTHTA